MTRTPAILTWISSVPPGKSCASVSMRLRQLILNPFSVHHPVVYPYRVCHEVSLYNPQRPPSYGRTDGHWFVHANTQYRVQYGVNSYEVHGRRSLFDFPMLIIIPPLLQTHLSLHAEVSRSPDHAANYHILGFYVGRFVTAPALHWLQSEEVCF